MNRMYKVPVAPPVCSLLPPPSPVLSKGFLSHEKVQVWLGTAAEAEEVAGAEAPGSEEAASATDKPPAQVTTEATLI